MKKIKLSRFAAAVSAAAVLVSGASLIPQSIPTKAASLTGLDAFGITSQMTVGWNLGNTLDCSGTGYSSTANPSKFATAWGNPVPTAELFQTVKDAGFNTVRIPTTWYEHIEWDESSQMYVINDSWMDFVKQTVDYAYDEGMFVILNVHHEDWVNVSEFTDATYEEAAKKMEDIWTQIADEFADYDQHLIFEGMNEPRQTGLGSTVEWGSGDTNSRAYINKLNAVFVNTIRSQGSSANAERLLMLPGYCASAESASYVDIPANSGNVAISVHAYSPYYFTMATDSMANHTFPGSSGWGENYEQSLDSLFNSLKQISQSKNVPIVIGEFGASDFDNTDSRVAWATYYLTKAKEAGFPCVLWDNNVSNDGSGEAHGYLYRLTNTWYPNSAPVVKAMMNVYGISSTLPEYEEYVAPEFSWDQIPVGDDWIELFKPSDGKTYKAWDNALMTNWQQYANENYEFVLVYQSASDPYLVLAPVWNKIISSEESDNTFMMRFSYEDIIDSMNTNGVSLSDMTQLYISASSEALTVYGFYAVPLSSTTDATTEPTTTEVLLGDVDDNGYVSVLDVVTLQKYLLNLTAISNSNAADVTQDGDVDAFDLAYLKHMIFS
jgi:aryl-phospho-beta-D-glucosidase BglC (GH1 family)